MVHTNASVQSLTPREVEGLPEPMPLVSSLRLRGVLKVVSTAINPTFQIAEKNAVAHARSPATNIPATNTLKMRST